MTWTKLDDGFWSNPKVVGAGNEAVGVYARALSYCSYHLTEGRVPGEVLRFLAGSRKPIARLLEQGLIVENGAGYEIPDFLEFNPTREEALAKRQARAEAGRRGGLASAEARKKQANASTNATPPREANA